MYKGQRGAAGVGDLDGQGAQDQALVVLLTRKCLQAEAEVHPQPVPVDAAVVVLPGSDNLVLSSQIAALYRKQLREIPLRVGPAGGGEVQQPHRTSGLHKPVAGVQILVAQGIGAGHQLAQGALQGRGPGLTHQALPAWSVATRRLDDRIVQATEQSSAGSQADRGECDSSGGRVLRAHRPARAPGLRPEPGDCRAARVWRLEARPPAGGPRWRGGRRGGCTSPSATGRERETRADHAARCAGRGGPGAPPSRRGRCGHRARTARWVQATSPAA